MKIQNILSATLLEMPLPVDWDKNAMSSNVSFAKKIAYARERAKRIGGGSSRVAFEIPYEGRKTVLKIAKNAKGLAQNEHEASFFNDYYLKSINLVIPIIDFDEDNNMPQWLHMEYATKAKPSDFVKACGLTLDKLIYGIELMTGKARPNSNQQQQWKDNVLEDLLENNELFKSLFHLMDYDIPLNEFNSISNWGVYNNNLVIIDLGLSHDIWDNHYAK